MRMGRGSLRVSLMSVLRTLAGVEREHPARLLTPAAPAARARNGLRFMEAAPEIAARMWLTGYAIRRRIATLWASEESRHRLMCCIPRANPMPRLLFVAEDVFEVKGRGIVVLPAGETRWEKRPALNDP